jgi:hypothetical protein
MPRSARVKAPRLSAASTALIVCWGAACSSWRVTETGVSTDRH